MANNADLTISVINARGGVVSQTIKLNDQPAGIAVAPDGSQIYTTFTNTGATAILDAHDWTISKTVPVGSSPGSVVVSPDGSQLYVLNSGDGSGPTRVSVLERAGASSNVVRSTSLPCRCSADEFHSQSPSIEYSVVR